MFHSFKKVTLIAGITCALTGAAPVASAVAATSAPTFTTPGYVVPQITFPWQQPSSNSCGADQGIFPGFINLGPTGPLGPLGSHGPLGAGHLPCGASVFDLGPGGPLGPSGPLGSLMPTS